ncbi:MAG: hypothetical protein A2499_00325 [Stygiobacter sp. RIFOXYC12_FULL_38_8]|nr:MAG: hypothetical protein A2279_09770 [Stygiobacter sp. RIFOXYA12_FULL_38_9]OGV06528.1 MAG: hypothetical protein A2299_02380 [Stygiobacter sp. RIFOXYB2_FULL_37_11]OGV13211.1 MAG: hypothetical protein A2440_12840 [Stygiobacter sp. RIFOXYC2_FULL_38_25]OGV14648.1 MAG: hypothetical protein A2237_03440 [Stygiobacter sp. RIFOXYA2_FULL_38_8]OGV26430.1 MAG: hypothetical protein A2499_00325 [Stygiobacter sp. RIFOXYC12_FULL_38_8]OGV83257.1 MAG: hypothetical protein A2X65_16395 [Stygiobacter sp. GWF2_
MKKNLPEKELGENTFEVIISYEDISIDINEIEILLGYQSNQIPEHFSNLIGSAITDLRKKINIRAGYRILNTKQKAGNSSGLLIGDKFFNLGKIVTGFLKRSESMAVFCVTIGSEMESYSKELIRNGDPLLGYVYDTVASEAVESSANVLHDHITEQMRKSGFKVTNGYSPGYCNWKVDEQHLLFSLLPGNFCGISLTEMALMQPIKSISGIIGGGHNVKFSDYSCDECTIKDCTQRLINDSKKNKLRILHSTK